MSAMDAALPGIAGHDAARSLRERWFAGLTWKAVALVVAMGALYGEAAVLAFSRAGDGSTRAVLEIPWPTEGEDQASAA